MVAPVGPLRTTVKVSVGSDFLSAAIVIVIVLVVSPLLNVNVPEAALKSPPARALPATVAQLTVDTPELLLRVTVSSAVTVGPPLLPSVTVTLLMLSVGGAGGASSLVIVTLALPSAMLAPFGLVRSTRNISSASNVVSPLIVIEIVCDVWPGVNVTMPDGADVVGAGRGRHVGGRPRDRDAVGAGGVERDGDGRRVLVPLLPSVTVASAIVMFGSGGRVVVADRHEALPVGDRGADSGPRG